MIRLLFLINFLFLFATTSSAQEGMNNQKMDEIFQKQVQRVEGLPGSWQLFHDDRILLVLTDEAHNRMRIFSPIVEEKDIEKEHLVQMLEANFHTALDAKYSLYEGFVVSVFTHPLKELTEEQLIDAMNQVNNLAITFGTTYSSTDIIFGSGEDKKEQEGDKKVNQSPSKNTKKS